MSEIKSLKKENTKIAAPPIWTMFLDGTNPPAFSYTRITGAIFLAIFLGLLIFVTLKSGVMFLMTKEWAYVLVAFCLIKPLQRFAEAKDNETQLNYEFQMAQLSQIGLAGASQLQPPPVQQQPVPVAPFFPPPNPNPDMSGNVINAP